MGLYDYKARYYDPDIGRFISSDTIVPAIDGNAVGLNSQQRLTPLVVDAHEPSFLSQVNSETQQLVRFGPSSTWNNEQKQEFQLPMGPLNPQSLNRYAYTLNNPVRYIDPSGHTWTEIGRTTLTITELRSLIIDFRNMEAFLKYAAIFGGVIDAILVLIPDITISKAAAAVIFLMAALLAAEGEQHGQVADFLDLVLDEALDAANVAADALGLEEGSQEREDYIENYTIDLIVSDVSNEGFFYNTNVVLTSSVTGTRNIYIWGALALNLAVVAPTW